MKMCFHRHRKVLEKVADIDYVLKVWTIPYIQSCSSALTPPRLASIFILFHSSPEGPDNPWVWWALYCFELWLQIMHRLLPWRQSRQETAQYSGTHLVSECGRWPVFSATWWVQKRRRWANVSSDVSACRHWLFVFFLNTQPSRWPLSGSCLTLLCCWRPMVDTSPSYRACFLVVRATWTVCWVSLSKPPSNTRGRSTKPVA